MALFAVIGLDHPPDSMALREEYRAEHRSYVRGNDDMTRLAGALFNTAGNQCGTLTIFEADNAEQVWEWYRAEPFYRNKVYKDFTILEWRAALNLIEKTNGWVTNYPRGRDSEM